MDKELSLKSIPPSEASEMPRVQGVLSRKSADLGEAICHAWQVATRLGCRSLAVTLWAA
jgi:hypothetical protein